MKRTYTVMLIPDPDGGYVVEVPALPGCVSFGDSLSNALDMASDAILNYLFVLQSDGEAIPREGPHIVVSLGDNREAILRKVVVETEEVSQVA
ncbi:MAG TPA: type II toxin-antitoxin system HicB family antitoxin [Candidatus Latescibacteria bacterium]|nr:type II toxin-antitoxin system HicB family antitoxin [Candidatus Latescibacterota bacterium]